MAKKQQRKGPKSNETAGEREQTTMEEYAVAFGIVIKESPFKSHTLKGIMQAVDSNELSVAEGVDRVIFHLTKLRDKASEHAAEIAAEQKVDDDEKDGMFAEGEGE